MSHWHILQRSAIFLVGVLVVVLGFSPVGARLGAQGETGFDIDVAITQATVVPKTGEVTLRGTVTCTDPGQVSVYLRLRQDVGRFRTLRGAGGTTVDCGSTFAVQFLANEGRFGAGNATVEIDAYGCASGEGGYPSPSCDSEYSRQSIRLRSGR